MRPSLIVPLLLLAWPIGEIAMFAWVGGRIGVINTIGLVLLAGFAGVALLRIEGFNLMRRLQAELAAGRMPTGELLEASFVLLAAFLLVLPGFLSDILAFLLLFSPIRRLLVRLLGGYVLVRGGRVDRREATPDGVVDLDADEYTARDAARPGGEVTLLPPGDDQGPHRP